MTCAIARQRVRERVAVSAARVISRSEQWVLFSLQGAAIKRLLRFFNPCGIEKPARFSHWVPNAVGTWALSKAHDTTAGSICQVLFW
jgi:hypothetical protein